MQKGDLHEPFGQYPMSKRSFGLADPSRLATMSGRDLMQAMIDGAIPQPPIGQAMCFYLVEVGDGFVVFEGNPDAQLLNPLGHVHGGFALTVIDSACGAAAHSLLGPGVGFGTIETKGNFCRPITRDTGRLRAEGRVVSQGRRVILSEARILSSDGRVMAHGTSTVMVL
ncbi:MAG TPA: PaaI family thioesterase [Ilumatobacter sp.]|jgi:uncharacterized protein (TIGR00369 family)|nr:PaaI family thioesterase [Ilumatobacter sp.]